jgi:hypothetical protein
MSIDDGRNLVLGEKTTGSGAPERSAEAGF